MSRYQGITFVSRKRLTQAEFAQWLDGPEARGDLHYELLGGYIVQEPPASWPHGEIAAEILVRLHAHVRRHRLGRVFDSSQGFELPTGDTLEPDVSFVSNARWREARPERGKFLRVVPDLVVEVLSPSTAGRDRREKKRVYARCGVREYWLVDDETRSVARLVGDGTRFRRPRVFPAGTELASILLEGLRLPVAELFPEA